MINMEIKSKKPITIYESIKILEKREKDGELEYEQKEALEYAKKFAQGTEKLVKELSEIVDEETAVILANILPKDEELIRTIAVKNKLDLKEEDIKKIISIINKSI